MSRKHLETLNGNDQVHPFLKGWRSQLRLHMGSQTWSSFEILKCEVIRCPTRKAKRVNLLWEFTNLKCSSSVVDPCLLSRAQRSIRQLTSLRGLVWVPWPISPQHSSFRHLILYFWQGGESSTPTKTLKAVVVASGWIYPSRSCTQVELPQCGYSRKLVWISRSLKWLGDSMSNLKVDTGVQDKWP